MPRRLAGMAAGMNHVGNVRYDESMTAPVGYIDLLFVPHPSDLNMTIRWAGTAAVLLLGWWAATWFVFRPSKGDG